MSKKKVQKKNQPGKKPTKPSNIKIALFALGILVLLIFIAKLFGFFISLQKPLSGDLNTHKLYSWDKKSSYNIAFITSPESSEPDISVVSIQPTEQKATVLHLSSNIYAEVAKGYGLWRLGSVYNLGNEEDPKRGAYLFKLTLTRLLGAPIDGIVLLPESSNYQNVEDLVSSFHKAYIPDIFYLTKIKSDLNKIEAFDIYKNLSGIRPDKISSLNFERSSITESKLLADTSRVLGVNTVKLDLFIRDNLADPTIIDENTPVAVFNATDQLGLGQEVARMITNMGGNVIILQNLDQKQENSLITITPGSSPEEEKKLRSEVTYQRITQLVAPACLKKSCVLDNAKITDSRATINVVIGQDYLKTWYQK